MQPLWKTAWQPLKRLNAELPYCLAMPLLQIYPQRVESRDSDRCLYTHVSSDVIHNSSKVKAILVSIDRWMDKQMFHTTGYYPILEENSDSTDALTQVNLEDIMPDVKEGMEMVLPLSGTESNQTHCGRK